MSDISRIAIKQIAKKYFKSNKPKIHLEKYIPVSGKVLDEQELCNLIDASLDMWLTTGRFNDNFEKNLAKFLNIKYVLSVNSGSSANLLALSALTSYKLGKKQLKKGDEVITVASSFPTTVNPIIQLGLIPVFVDCNIESCNIDEKKVEEAITKKLKQFLLLTH